MTGQDHSRRAAVKGSGPQRAEFTLVGLRCLLSQFFWCVLCGTNQMVLHCGLKLAIGCLDSGNSWECLWCRTRSATICVPLRTPLARAESDLRLIAACVDLRGMCERQHYEMKWAATSTGTGATQQKAQGMLRQATACLGPLDL